MDNQKILWIVFSITLFLLAVVVVGFIWFLPPDTESPEDAIANADVVAETSEGFDPIEWARETKAVPGIETSDEDATDDGESPLLVIGDADDQGSMESSEEADSGIVVAEESETAAETRTVTRTQSQPQTQPQTQTAPAPETTARTTTTRAQPAPTPAPAPMPAPQPRTVTITHYWIQAGSFASRSRAEDTQQALKDTGITARLTSIDVSDTTYFRVRIGPYDSKAEAEKFLGWIKDIDSFGSSYISEVYTTRTVN